MSGHQFKLYHYWRSSSSWRVRWALATKGIECELVPINLLTNEADQPDHLQRNPLGYVPVLEVLQKDKNAWLLTESTAILEFLEELYPEPALITGDSYQRARIRQLAQIINSDTQPLQNPHVVEKFSTDPAQKLQWSQLWIRKGLQAYEIVAKGSAGKFSIGDTVTLADLFLVPQCYNALRNEISLSEFPLLERIYSHSMGTDECKKSAPEIFKPSGQ